MFDPRLSTLPAAAADVAAADPPGLTRFTLDSAYGRALLAPWPSRPLPSAPAPFPSRVRCINPHLGRPGRPR